VAIIKGNFMTHEKRPNRKRSRRSTNRGEKLMARKSPIRRGEGRSKANGGERWFQTKAVPPSRKGKNKTTGSLNAGKKA